MFILFLVFYISSTTSTSLSSTSQSPLSCGTPDSKEESSDLIISPNQSFVLNAPFDIGIMDFFEIKLATDRRVAYRIEVRQSRESRIEVPKTQGILGSTNDHEYVSVGFSSFDFDKKLHKNDSITINWVNIPKDATSNSIEDCFGIWFNGNPRNHILKIEYNP